MSNNVKVFIVVLFLIGILFVVGINIGATKSSNLSFKELGWLSGDLGTALAHSQSLQLADLSPRSANCVQRGELVVPVGGTCTFDIKQSPFASRVVMLQLVKGTGATVKLDQEQTLSGIQPLNGTNARTNNDKNDMKIYPGKAHGMLSIECTNVQEASTCFLTLLK
jgi:hypothetical protein